jgi:hypothetical protein
MAPLAALVAAFMAAVLPDVPGALPLRVVSDVVECPSRGEVQAALRQVLGEGQESGGWTLWYGRDTAAPVAERGASLLMELVDPAGERLTVRRIPSAPDDCAAIGTAMAAVVERSLRDLGWTRGDPLPESAGPWAPEAPAATMPEAVAEKPVAPVGSADRLPRLLLGAGPGWGTSSRLGTNLLLDARLGLLGPLCLRLGALAFAGSASTSLPSTSNGRASLSSRTFTISPQAAFLLGPLELAGGPVVWLAADQASSSNLPRVGRGSRLVMAVGAGIGVVLPLSRRWRVGLDLAAVRVVFAPDITVDWNGTRSKVLAPAPWQGLAAAKLEFVPWP